MTFRATVLVAGKTATGIPVPDEVVTALGAGRRPAVRVTVNGYSYRTTIANMGGTFMFPVSADIRARAGVAGGDAVDVEIELDTEVREVAVPADFAAVLATDPAAGKFFESLSNSNKASYLQWIESAKKAETRARRLPEALELLRSGRKHR